MSKKNNPTMEEKQTGEEMQSRKERQQMISDSERDNFKYKESRGEGEFSMKILISMKAILSELQTHYNLRGAGRSWEHRECAQRGKGRKTFCTTVHLRR